MRARAGLLAAGAALLALSSAAPPAVASPNVTVTMTINNCDKCVITAWNTIGDIQDDLFEKKAIVSDGRAVFVVPQNMTLGMSFDIQTPDHADALGGGAVPVIAMGFEGVPTGSVVTKAQTMRRGAQANWCWAGTTPTTTAATIRVRTYYNTIAKPKPWQGPVEMYAWASPSQPTYNDVDNMQDARAMGHQDAPYC